MAIFRYELRQLRGNTFWWGASIALITLMILPAYINMLTSGAVDAASVMNNDFFEMLGADASIISTPIGVFGYVNSFFVIAAGIYGMSLGLKSFTKETVGKTSEYTYTKPYGRGRIYAAKILSATVSALAVGACYLGATALCALTAAGGRVDYKPFGLIALSFTLIEIFFILFGACAGAIYSKIRAPLLASSGVVFMFYALSAYAGKVNINVIKYLTPFSYFGASKIVLSGGYNAGYMSALLALCAAFAATGYAVFIKKDVSFIS